MVINYLLLSAERIGCGPKVALWGHGTNRQASKASIADRFKSCVARMPNWWFAYTTGVANTLVTQGVQASRISVVGNTIDVVGLRQRVESARAARHTAPNPAIGLFLGGLYQHKKLDVLFEAADIIFSRLPEFELHIAGTGEQRGEVEEYAKTRPWVSYRGVVDGEAHASLLANARLLLVPGLVGLVIIDSFAAGVPLVTTADALHSPEIEYLEHGKNGVMIPVGVGPRGYADTVIGLLDNPSRWEALSAGAWRSAPSHTLECAARNFVEGLCNALPTNRVPTR